MKSSSAHNPLFHLKKRLDIPKWQAWLIRGIAVVVAILVCAIITAILANKNGNSNGFAYFFQYLFYGTFGTPRRILILFQDIAMLLIVALAVTPAFKMKFWNIGAEGQVLMGALISSMVMYFMGPMINNNAGTIIIMLLFSIISGVIWAVIPAIFKAQWNTNETLFTLMMNYIAASLVKYTINKIVTNGSGTMGLINTASQIGWMPKLGQYEYIINILIVAVLTVLLSVYLRYSKHGFELSVVGGSINTAKYVGINVKKVVVRTMALSGALCGVAGFLLVSGTSHTINADLAGGRGFTAILVSWLAQFNPLTMFITSFLVVFIDQGASEVATMLRFGASFSDMIIGIFFFFVIATEFFINYQLSFNKDRKLKETINEEKIEVKDETIKVSKDNENKEVEA